MEKANRKESRREFLKTAGKFAVYTPPALMIMSQSNTKAIAGSGGGYNGGNDGGGNDGGGNSGGGSTQNCTTVVKTTPMGTTIRKVCS